MSQANVNARLLVYQRQEEDNQDILQSKHPICVLEMPMHEFSTSLRCLLAKFAKLKSKCFALRENSLSTTVTLDSFLYDCVKTFTENNWYDLVVLTILQKSETYLYKDQVKESLRCVKRAHKIVMSGQVEHRSYLMASVANAFVSRYKRLNKPGKAFNFLQIAKDNGSLLEMGECTAHVLWAEGGYYKAMWQRSENNSCERWKVRDQAIECYLRSMDHTQSDVQLEQYGRMEMMYCLIEIIRILTDFPEEVKGQTRDIVTEKCLENSEYYLEKLVKFTAIHIVGESKESRFLETRLQIIRSGYHFRQAQFCTRAEQYDSAREAFHQCFFYGQTALKLATAGSFCNEREQAQGLLKFAKNLYLRTFEEYQEPIILELNSTSEYSSSDD